MSFIEEDRPVATFEGSYSRLYCTWCEDMFEVEEDVQNGEIVECDACGSECVVERTT